jgi:tetratricopeptide (TPR) repeat protein
MNLALESFQRCVARDDGNQAIQDLFRAQFAKSYYNIGMIYDKLGKVQDASDNYKKSMSTCEADTQNLLVKSATYKKAGTNFAVTLEKLQKRENAVEILSNLKNTFGNEVRVYNNLGIIQKRSGDQEGAQKSYESALQVDAKSFFPNYNMGVLLSQQREKEKVQESLEYF